jgi:hypothetical protein
VVAFTLNVHSIGTPDIFIAHAQAGIHGLFLFYDNERRLGHAHQLTKQRLEKAGYSVSVCDEIAADAVLAGYFNA